MNRLNITVVAVLLAFAVQAQTPTWGIKSGANMAKLTEIQGVEFRPSFHFGATANLVLSQVFALQPEILYSGQGYKDDINGQTVRAKIDYLNIPVLADITVAPGLSIQAGPQIGINIRRELDVDNQENGMVSVNDVDFSIVAGIQYMFDPNFFAQARFAQGLTEVITTSPDNKNMVLSLSFGFFFDNPAAISD